MARRLVGVDIGATAVRGAEVSSNGGGPTLVRAAQVPLGPGAVQNGEVKDNAAVGDALKELWRLGKFSSRKVVLGVANQRVTVREVTLPWLAEKEFRAALPFQIQEFVPIPVDEAVLDYKVTREFDNDDRRMVRLLLVVAQKSMVDQIVQAADSARLLPVGIDLIPFAVMRSVGNSAVFSEDEETEAVIDIGVDVTSMCIHSQGVPRFVRILPVGGGDVTAAITRGADVTVEEAEAIKRGRPVNLAPEVVEEAKRILASRTSSFVDEIRSSLDFFESQSQARIKQVLVTGGGSQLPGLIEALNDRIPAEVEQGRPFTHVTVPSQMQGPEMSAVEPLLAVAIGLATPGGES